MNRALLRARIAIALILLIGIFVLIGLLIVFKPSIPTDTKSIVEGAIAQIVILLGFAVHALFQRGAEVLENPTQPPVAATPGVQIP